MFMEGVERRLPVRVRLTVSSTLTCEDISGSRLGYRSQLVHDLGIPGRTARYASLRRNGERACPRIGQCEKVAS